MMRVQESFILCQFVQKLENFIWIERVENLMEPL